MNAIDFVVRSDVGGVQRDVLQADAQNTTLRVESGSEVSFNLTQGDVQEYLRIGEDLQITLADGRVIVLDGYFANVAEEPRLFVSSDGELHEVFFAEGENGMLFAEYGKSAEWGKWSPDEQLIHWERADVIAPYADGDESQVSMLAAGLLGGSGLLGAGAAGAAALGAAALVGGGSDGGGSGGGGVATPVADPVTPTTPVTPATPAAPTVDDNNVVVGGDDAAETFDVTGTGEPGDAVTVTVGDETVKTEVKEDGTWKATFDGDDFPADGEYDVSVSVETENGAVGLDGPEVVIDLTPPVIDATQGTVEVGDLLNEDGHKDGLTVTGTGEPGTEISVTIGEVTKTETVGEDGSWAVKFETSEIDPGTYTTDVVVRSEDSFGNSSTFTHTLQVDTEHSVSINDGAIGGNGIINEQEWTGGANGGFAVTGSSDANADIVLTVGGQQFTTTANGDGEWSVSIPQSLVPTGETTLDMSVVATDSAGNVSRDTGSVEIDTIVNELAMTSTHGGRDGVVNISESGNGLILSGVIEEGAQSLMVTFGTTTVPAVISGGTWNAEFTSDQIPFVDNDAVQVTLVGVDAHGNERTETASINVDTDPGYVTISSDGSQGDGVINSSESTSGSAGGVDITGTATPFAFVTVGFGSSSMTVQANGQGQWVAPFTAGQVPADTDSAQITAEITDAAGNSVDASDTVAIDTVVDNYAFNNLSFGVDDVINSVEAGQLVTISGTTEVGTQWVNVTLDGGTTVSANVNADAGTWTVQIPAGTFPQGVEIANYPISIEAMDRVGNIDTRETTIEVDTIVRDLALDASSATADGVVSLAELNSDGLMLSGTVESGAKSVRIQIGDEYYNADIVGGAWTVTVPGNEVPRGDNIELNMTIHAEDAAGNIDSTPGSVMIDTVAPEGPEITFVLEAPAGVAGTFVGAQDEVQEVYEVEADGSIGAVAYGTPTEAGANTIYSFTDTVPDGSHLVVASADDAGNTRGTFLALEDGAAGTGVDMSNAGLGALNIDTIQLEFAEDSELTLSEADILALSAETNTVKVTGGSDDQVNLAGAERGATVTEGDQTFVEYTLGEATILIDSEITNVVT